MGKSKEIKKNWTGLKNLDICFCVILTAMTKVFFSGKETATPTNLETFLIFPSLLRS